MTFQPAEHLIKIKTKRGLQDYLNVQARLLWFRDQHPHGIITTDLAHLDLERQIAVFHARVEDGEGGVGEGYGSESAKDFDDYIEKAGTKAIGRALLVLGFGTAFAADELNEDQRLVDTPVPPTKPISTLPVDRQEPASEIIAPVPSKLRTMFVSIGTTLETAEKLTLKRVVNDLELTPEECFQLHQVYDAWKKRYDAKQAKAS